MPDPAPEWGKTLSLYIDVSRAGDGPVVEVGETSVRDTRAATMIQGDQRPLRLHFGRRDADGAWQSYALDAGTGIAVAGKAKDNLSGDVLFYADDFTQGGEADAPYYDGLLSLTAAELDTALASAGSIDCLADVVIEHGGAGLRAIAQYEVTVKRRVHDSDPPTPIVIPDAGQKWVTASDGKRRLAYYFTEDSTWRVMLPVVVGGQPTFTWEDVAE